MIATRAEINSQPAIWADERISQIVDALPGRGLSVGIIGCGTSFYISQSYAAYREMSGHGLTDAFAASVVPRREWDYLIALSRSGTTTEVLNAIGAAEARRTIALTASENSPIASEVDQTLVASFADEISVVQTRFATTALVALLASVSYRIVGAIEDANKPVAGLPDSVECGRSHFVFVGSGWTYGIANEAALKLREMAGCWSESYAAMEYRHGPIAVSGPETLMWGFGPRDHALAEVVAETGAAVHWPECDPLASLVEVQRLGLRLGVQKGIDPDRPRHLSRSVILSSAPRSIQES